MVGMITKQYKNGRCGMIVNEYDYITYINKEDNTLI